MRISINIPVFILSFLFVIMGFTLSVWVGITSILLVLLMTGSIETK